MDVPKIQRALQAMIEARKILDQASRLNAHVCGIAKSQAIVNQVSECNAKWSWALSRPGSLAKHCGSPGLQSQEACIFQKNVSKESGRYQYYYHQSAYSIKIQQQISALVEQKGFLERVTSVLATVLGRISTQSALEDFSRDADLESWYAACSRHARSADSTPESNAVSLAERLEESEIEEVRVALAEVRANFRRELDKVQKRISRLKVRLRIISFGGWLGSIRPFIRNQISYFDNDTEEHPLLSPIQVCNCVLNNLKKMFYEKFRQEYSYIQA